MQREADKEEVMTKSTLKPLLAIIATNFLWGLDFIVIDYMMDYVSAPIFTLVRIIVSLLILLPMVFITKKGLHIDRADIPKFLAAGITGMSLYFTVEHAGTGLTSASFSALIMATVPVFGIIGDKIFFGNKITPFKIICIIISIAGVYLLVSGEPMGISVLGFIAMVAAAILWTAYLVLAKPISEKYDLATLLCGLMLSALAFQIPVAVISQTVAPAHIEITPTGIIVTVLSAIVCITIGDVLDMYAVAGLSTTVVSAFENVLPVTTVIFSFIIFGAMLTGMQIIGGILILASVTAITLTDNKK